MSTVRSVVVLLGLMGFSGALYVATLGHPDQAILFSAVAIVLVVLSVGLEHLKPFDRDWNTARGDVIGDLSSLVLIFGLLDGVLKWATPFVVLALVGTQLNGLGAVPLWLEVILVALLIEFGSYWSHRLHHEWPKLWALHAMHHSPKRIYTLNNFRFHPLNHIINHGLMIGPALALGASPDAVLGYIAVATPILVLQHANVSFEFGWLNFVINTNAVHRWHHSAQGAEGNCNYGRAFLIWDHVFGTFYFPKAARQPDDIGVEPGFVFPDAKRFVDQLKYPFTAACCAPPENDAR